MGWVEEKEKKDMFNKHCKKVALIMALSMMTSVTAFAEKKNFKFDVVVERIRSEEHTSELQSPQ